MCHIMERKFVPSPFCFIKKVSSNGFVFFAEARWNFSACCVLSIIAYKVEDGANLMTMINSFFVKTFVQTDQYFSLIP